jgi:hypothetical protein
MPQYVRLPDGNLFPLKEGEDPASALGVAEKLYPEAFGLGQKTPEKQPKSGLMPALKSGIAGLQADAAALKGRVGIGSLEEAEQEIAKQKAYQAKTYKPTEENFAEAPFTKMGELIGGSLPYMALPLVAGAAIGSAPVAGALGLGAAGATALGIGAAGAASAAQFTGSNLSRQMDTGKKLGETNLFDAAVASLPQAALDTISLRMMPGVGKILQSAGINASEKVAANYAKEALKKTAADYVLSTGKTMTIEGLTEAGQQVFERMQAGLSITDPAARQEYFDNFVGGAVLGGVLAPAGRYVERGQEQGRFDAQQREVQRAQAVTDAQAKAQAAAEKQAQRQTPEFAIDAQTRYNALLAQMAELDKVADAKLEKNDLAGQELKRKAQAERKALRNSDDAKTAIADWNASKANLPAEPPAPPAPPAPITDTTQLQEQPLFPEAAVPTTPELDIFGNPMPQAMPEAAPEEKPDLQKSALGLRQYFTQLQEEFTKLPANAYEQKRALNARAATVEKALEVIESELPERVDVKKLTADIAVLHKKAAKAADLGDIAASTKHSNKAEELENKLAAAVPPPSPIEMPTQVPGYMGVSETAEQMATRQAKEQEANRLAAQQKAKEESDAYVEQRLQERRTQRKLEERNQPPREQPQRDEEQRNIAEKETISKLLATLPQNMQVTPGEVMHGLGGEQAHQRDLQTRLAIAKLTRNAELIDSLGEQLDDLKETRAARIEGAGPVVEQRQRALGEGRLPESRAKEAAAEQHADKQGELLQQFVAQLQKVKLRPDNTRLSERLEKINATREAAGKPPITLADESSSKLDTVRMAYLESHLNEIETRRAAFGLPPMADWEVGNARARVMESFNELQNRWGQAVPKEAPAGQRQFGAPVHAVATLQDQMRSNIFENVASAADRMLQDNKAKNAEKTVKRTAEPQFERDEQGQLRQVGYARPTGPQPVTERLELKGQPKLSKDEKQDALDMIDRVLNHLETRTRGVPTSPSKPPAKVRSLEDIAKLLEKEKTTGSAEKMDEASIDLLRQLRDALPDTSDAEFIMLAREQVQRVMEGNLPNQFAVRELGDMIAAQKEARRSETAPGATPETLQRTSAQPQISLFPDEGAQTVRATPENFQRLLDSGKVQEVRDFIAQQRAENQAALETVLSKIQPAKTAAQKAAEALARAKKKAEPILDKAKKELAEPDWYAPAVRKVQELETALQSIPPRIKLLKDIREKIAGLNDAEKATLAAQVDKKLKTIDKVKNPNAVKELLELKDVLKNSASLNKEINRLSAAVRLAKRTIEKAREDLKVLNEVYALEAPERATLAKQAKAATTRVEKLTSAANAAQNKETREKAAEEKAASKEVPSVATPMNEWRAALQRGREGLNLPGTRNLVDTSGNTPKIFGLRKKLGSLDSQIQTLLDPTRKPKKDDKAKAAKLMALHDAALEELDSVYEKSPRITSEIKEEGQLQLEKAFDDAQAAAYDGVARRKQKRAGELPPTLAATKKGQTTKNVRTGRVTETAERVAPTGRVELAARVLEGLADARAELKTLQDRMQFLRDNGKAKQGTAKTSPYTEAFKKLQEKEETLKKKVARIDQTAGKIARSEKETKAALASARKNAGAATTGKAALEAQEAQDKGGEFAKLMDEAEELNLTVPHDDVKFAVRDNDIMGVIDGLAKHGSTPAIRERAKGLREFLHGTTIGVDRFVKYQGEMVAGLYEEGRNKITMHPNRVTEEDLLHELTHAATTKAMRTPDAKLTPMQREAKQGIINLFKAAEGRMDLTGQYGIKDVHEFMSEVNSSKDFRDRLDGIGKPMSLWQKLKRWIAGLFNQSPSKEALDLIEKIYMPSETYFAKEGEQQAFAKVAKYGEDNDLSQLAQRTVAQKQGWSQTMRGGSNYALEFEMQTTDMRAALRKVMEMGAKAFGDSRLFQQAMYSYTKADQKMPLVLSALSNGPLEMYEDAKGLKGIRSTGKDSAKEVFDAVGDIPDRYGNEAAKMQMATMYLIAQRAANKGLAKLDLGALGITQQEVDAAMIAAEANPQLKGALEKVRERYNAYNKGMIEFLAETGAITKAEAQDFLREGDYVPYYRVKENGIAELVFGGERTIRIGDIRHQPHLAALKGGEAKILPINESIPRNTTLLVSKAMTNLAARNVGYAMQEIGKSTDTMQVRKGYGVASDASIIRFNQEPDPNDPKDTGERHVRVQTNGTIAEGIPAELLIQSLEGAPLTLPGFLKWGGIAGDLLRAGVTRTPLYLMRQLFRDPMAATATAGLDYGMLTAVYKANKEFLKMSTGQSTTAAELIKKGLMQSGIFTGDPDDISKFALQLASGKDFNAFDKLFRRADKAALNADAATRALVYENAIKNGLSEVEAEFAVMESMNFHKRGLSPMVQYASRMIPFFNAQIQGLNVLYKAATGQMPFEEQLKIKQKFYNNAMLLAAGGIAYAMAMQDDDYYKNAKPKDRYSNFFLHTPFTDEPLKLPIPYEFGWFFSLGAAAADAMAGQTDGGQQLAALQSMFKGAIPGASSMGVPQLVKPIAEVWTNKDFNTGFELESTRLRGKSVEERYNANTTELAKAMSKFAPVLSPIQIERIVGGYLGQVPIAVMAATNGLFKDGEVEPVPKNLSEMSLIGAAFQKKYGGADADTMYKLADEALQVKRDFDSMKREGRTADAKDLVENHRAELRAAPLALQYQKLMGNMRTIEERIRGSNMPGDEKRKRIDELQKRKQDLAEKFEQRIKQIES